jgi:hypothetical protein
MTVSNNEIVKAVMEVELPDGTIAQNTFHFLAQFTGDQTDVDVVAGIMDWLETAYNYVDSDIVDEVTVNPCAVNVIQWVTDKWEIARFIGIDTPDIEFASGAEMLPNQIAPYIVRPSTRPKSRGRTFLYGFGETETTGSYLNAEAMEDLALFAASIITGIEVTPNNYLYPVIVRSVANLWLGLYDAVANDIVGTQRRRRPTVGS